MATWDCTPNGIFNTTSFTSAIRTALNSGTEWSVTITPTNAFNTYSGDNALIANGNGGLWVSSSQIALYRDEDGAAVVNTGTITNTAGNPITITVRPVARQLVIAGASGAGNGTYTWLVGASGTFFSTGSVGVAQYSGGGFTFAGAVSDVTYTAASSTLTADAGAVALTGTAAAPLVGRRVIADPGAVAVTGTNAGLVGPSTYTLIASAVAFAITGADATLARTRVLAADAGSCVSTGTDATLTRSGGIEIGAHGKVVQLYGAGSNPAQVTLTTTNGSTFLVFIGGKSSDIDTGPTDNKGNTYARVDVVREYPDYAGYGQAVWITRNAVGGASHTFSTFVTAFDECTMMVVEVKGAPFVASKAFSTQANSGAGATQNVGPVVATAECAFLSTWAGAGPVGTNHTASANQGLAELEFYGTDNPNGYVQMELAGAVKSAGSYTVTWSHTPNQGAIERAIVLQAMPVLSADTGSVTVTGTAATLPRNPAPIAADTGALAITGTAAGLASSRALVGDAGSAALTGAAAQLLFGRALNAATAAFAVTGTVADVLKGLTVASDAGAFVVAGVDANVYFDRDLTAAAGALSVTGTDTTLSRTGAYTIGADATAFAVAGLDATLTLTGATEREILAAAGVVSVTGRSATLAWSGLEPHLPFAAIFVDAIRRAYWVAWYAAIWTDEQGATMADHETRELQQNLTPKTITARAFTSEGYPNLSTYTNVRFHMSGAVELDEAAVGMPNGYLMYTFTSGQLAVVGAYEAYFSATSPSGELCRFPESTPLRVVVFAG